MKNYETRPVEIDVATAKEHSWTAKYKLIASDFQLDELTRFGIPFQLPIRIGKETIIANYDALVRARKMGLKTIAGTEIIGLEEDAVPQVIAATIIKPKLSYRQLTDLTLDYLDYLKNNPFGKVWSNTIPGKKTLEKVGDILDESYGKLFGLLSIHKNYPNDIGRMDAGELGYVEADKKAKNNPTIPKKNSGSNAGNSIRGGNSSNNNKTGDDNRADTDDEPIMPRMIQKKVACQPIKGIVVRTYDGKEVELTLVGKTEMWLSIDGKKKARLQYVYNKDTNDAEGEYHVLQSKDKKGSIALSLQGILNLFNLFK